MALSTISLKKDPSFGLDSRRSWVTAVFLCLCMTTVLTGQLSVGVLFYGIVRTYGVSRKDASWPLMLSQSLSYLAGPMMGYLCSRFSCRVVLLVSTVMAGASVSSCFFADGIFYLNIMFGVVYGCAACGVHVTVNVLVSQHFEKRRTTACSIMYTFLGVNSLYLPPLAEFLRVTYGIRGTFLVLGGLILHSLPPVLAVRSPEWAKARRQPPGNTVMKPNIDSEATPNKVLLAANGAPDSDNPDDTAVPPQEAQETEFAQLPLMRNRSSFLKSLPSLGLNGTSTNKKAVGNSSFNTIVREFTSIAFAVNAVSFATIFLGLYAFLLLSVDIAMDKGILPSSGVFLLNAFAVTDIVTKPLSGLVIDSGLLSLESAMLLGYLLQSLALELFVWLDSFPLLLASAALFGVSNGWRITLLAPSVAKDFGVDRLPVVIGGVSFWSGVAVMTGPFLVGYWRDHMGSYDGLLHFVAVLNAVVAVIWITKLCLQRRHKPLMK